MRKAVKYIKGTILFFIVLSISAFIFSYLKKNNLPQQADIESSLFTNPKQSEIVLTAFEIAEDDHTYKITPKFSYELYGLVVSDYDSETWIDITHEHDPLNTKDICVVWGDNLKSDIYRKMKYSHGEWTCYYEAESSEDFAAFNSSQFSNNHLLPASDEVYKTIKNASVGDQIYLKGQLIDYEIVTPEGTTGTRETSTVRDDTGCEIIYTTEFQLISRGNEIFHTIYLISKYSILILIIALGIIFFAI